MSVEEETILIRKLKQSDKKAFDRIFRKYEQKLYAFCYKLTQSHDEAEEVVQETFLKIWGKRMTIDESKNFESFLFTIARHNIYNKARDKTYAYAYENYLKDRLDNKQKQNNETAESLQYRETWNCVKEAIERLPARRKEVFTLSKLNGLSNKEVADLTDTSVSNIENHINKALKQLRSYLSSHGIITAFLIIKWFV
jgi:RNA polymerase sigma-70 factor (ECF subfamily)